MRNTPSSARRFGAVLAALAMGVLAILGGRTPAQAAPNPAIDVDIVSLVKSDANGNLEPNAALRVGQVALLSFTWDATDPSITSGDSFEIEYGPTFRSRVTNQRYPIVFADVEIGACVTEESKVVCTLNDEFVEQRASFSEMRGRGAVMLTAVQQTTAETVPMTVTGTVVDVDLPGTGGIGAAPTAQFTPATLSKSATPLTETSTTVNWSVTFNIDHVNTVRAAAGLDAIPTDGTTVTSLTFTDVLGPGQSAPNDINLVRVVRTDPTVRQALATLRRGSILPNHSVAMTYDAATRTSQITITAPFLSDTNYTFGYWAPIVDGSGAPQNPVAGVRYTNTVSLDGTSASAVGERWLTAAFGIVVSYDPGFGGFKVVKSVGGDGVTRVAAATAFPVTATYTLPTGRTVDDYAGWTPPGTVNATRTGGTFTYDVILGANSAWNGSLPQGTQVTLTEDPTAATPAVSGVEWATPVFRPGNTATATFRVADQQVTTFQLANTVTLAYGTFTVAKTATGEDGRAATTEYTFAYDCGDGLTGTVRVPGDGVTTASGVRVPVGAECTLTEDEASAALDGYTLTPPAAQTLTVTSSATPAAFEFVNGYTRDTGSFRVVKTVTGADASALTFAFDYTCSEGTAGRIEAPGDGTPVDAGVTLPTGTTCTVTEDAAAAALAGHTVALPDPQELTVTRDEVATVEFRNAYTAVPEATPTPGGTAQRPLARTGADAGPLTAVAGLGLLAAGALLLRRRVS